MCGLLAYTAIETNPDSIASAVLATKPDLAELDEPQQKIALDYLSIQLAIRDREQLVKVLCHSSPDLFTSSIRSIVPAYDPIIRNLHNATDLSSGVSDFQAFLDDLIRVSTITGKGDDRKLPTVEDYCKLLQKHQGSSHRFIHQVLKNSKELSESYHEYALKAANAYKQDTTPQIDPSTGFASAGDFTAQLNTLFSTLPDADRTLALTEINAHATWLTQLTETSMTQMRSIITNLAQDKSETLKGPGMFLTRWQSLMDETPITPLTSKGGLRSGKSRSVVDATLVDTDGEVKGDADIIEVGGAGLGNPPSTKETVRLLGEGFRDVLRGMVDA